VKDPSLALRMTMGGLRMTMGGLGMIMGRVQDDILEGIGES